MLKFKFSIKLRNKMNFKIISLLTIFFLFLGCSNKANKYVTTSDILHEQAITQTQRTIIKDGENAQAYILVTYLNQIKHSMIKLDGKTEQFIVNIYIPSEENQKLYNEISCIINNKEQKPLKELKPSDKLLKVIPAVTSWSKYYLYEAPVNEKSKNILFKFKTNSNESSTLTFVKDYL